MNNDLQLNKVRGGTLRMNIKIIDIDKLLQELLLITTKKTKVRQKLKRNSWLINKSSSSIILHNLSRLYLTLVQEI